MYNKIFSINKKEYKTIIYILGIRIKLTSQKRINKLFQNILNIVCPPAKLPPAVGEHRNGQILSIKLLKDLKQVCEENNITYWIDFGTLLGAVRHKGYIPWDSDIDTSMLREDFYKVIPLLKEKYKGTDIEVREFGCINHFQIRLQHKDDDTYGVDIFPIDKYFKSEIDNKEVDVLNKKIKFAVKKLKRICKKSKETQTTPELYREKITQINNKYILNGNRNNLSEPVLYFAIDYPLPEKNLVRKYKDVFPLGEIYFEGIKFACPNNIENCIKYLYGENYMQYPPKFKFEEDKIKEYLEGMKGTENND